MSLLADAEYAYKSQRADVQFAGERELRRTYHRAHARAEGGNDIAKARLKALRDEFTSRGVEPPRA